MRQSAGLLLNTRRGDIIAQHRSMGRVADNEERFGESGLPDACNINHAVSRRASWIPSCCLRKPLTRPLRAPCHTIDACACIHCSIRPFVMMTNSRLVQSTSCDMLHQLDAVSRSLLMASAAALPLNTAFSTPAPRQKSPHAASNALSAVRQGLPKG